MAADVVFALHRLHGLQRPQEQLALAVRHRDDAAHARRSSSSSSLCYGDMRHSWYARARNETIETGATGRAGLRHWRRRSLGSKEIVLILWYAFFSLVFIFFPFPSFFKAIFCHIRALFSSEWNVILDNPGHPMRSNVVRSFLLLQLICFYPQERIRNPLLHKHCYSFLNSLGMRKRGG